MMKLRVGIVTEAFFYVPYWAAQAQGWYRDFGLDVEIVNLGGIVEVTDALKKGEIQVGVGSPEHVVHDVERGGDLRMFGGNVNALTHSLIVQPEIEKMEDLRGKTIGVSALNAGTSSLFIDLLARHGLHEGDYTIIVAGPVPPRHEKLMRREIDAAMQTDPHNYMAEDMGLRNLGLVSDWIPHFQFNSVNARLSWAEANRAEMVAFLRASIKGTEFMFTNQAGSVEVAATQQLMERKYLDRAWADHTTGAVPRDLHVDARSIATAVDIMRRDRASVTIAPDAAPSKYTAPDFLAQAQREEGLPVNPMAS